MFAEKSGTIAFVNGDRQLEMNWYPAEEYDDYHGDRLHVSAPQPATARRLDGSTGDLDRAAFDRILAAVVRVDVRTWLAALPANIVTPDRAGAAAAEVLVDVPLPPGFDVGSLDVRGADDPYQFGAAMTGRVGCAWIAG